MAKYEDNSRIIEGMHEVDLDRLKKLDKIQDYDSLLQFIIKYILENQIYLYDSNEALVYFYKSIINKYYKIKEENNCKLLTKNIITAQTFTPSDTK